VDDDHLLLLGRVLFDGIPTLDLAHQWRAPPFASGALLLSRVQTGVAEFKRRTPARDDEQERRSTLPLLDEAVGKVGKDGSVAR
jgi:hypothetical protein